MDKSIGPTVVKDTVKEIEELHQFFEEWFTGKIAEDEFTRFEQVLHPDFELITPGTQLFNRSQILDLVKSGYNTQVARQIWTEHIAVRNIGDTIIATYHEFQESDGKKTERKSSAVFTEAVDTPNNVMWIHVHETWISD